MASDEAEGNKVPTLTILEQKDCEKILDNQNGFPWTLIQDRNNVGKY